MEHTFELLLSFIDFIDKNYFEDFINDIAEEAQKEGLDKYHYFSFPSAEEMFSFFEHGNRTLFNCLRSENIEYYISITESRWLQRQTTTTMANRELSVNDALLYGHIRKRAFLKYIRLFTGDPDKQFGLINEIDQLLLRLNMAFNQTFRKLLKEKVDRELYLNERITETFPGFIYVFDLDEYKVIYSNNKIADMLGFTPEEIAQLGSDIITAVVPLADLQLAHDQIKKTRELQPGQINISEHRVIHKNGNIHWLRVYQSIFSTDEQGVVKQVIGICKDVTDHKMAEEELEKSRRDLETAQAIAGLGSYEWELGTSNIKGSAQFRKMFEWDGGKQDRRSKIHPEDLSRVDQELKICAETLNDFNCEYRIYTEEGERTVWSRGRVIDMDGKKVLKGTILDITEKSQLIEQLKRSDHLYRQAQALSHIGNWEYDLKTGKLEWSEEMYRIFSIDKAEVKMLSRETAAGYTHPDDRHFVDDIQKKLLECNEPADFNYRIISADGEVKYLRAITEIACKDGQPEKMYGTLQDVTKLMETERKLQETNLRLMRSNESLEQFAYIASHDLKEPVRKLMLFSDKFISFTQEQRVQDGAFYAERINTSAKKIRALIDDILAFSSTVNAVGFVPTDLNHIMKEVIEIFDLQIREKKAVLSIAPLPIVDAVPSQMKQLFQNLVSNSLKFCGTKPLNITISYKRLARFEKQALNMNPDQPYVKIIFTDNGIGFENEYAGKIFTIFQRLHDQNKYAGNGIGLAICKKIVDNHNGFIYAEGNPGTGAVFTVILPVNKATVTD